MNHFHLTLLQPKKEILYPNVAFIIQIKEITNSIVNLLISIKEITLFTEYSLYPDITLIHLTIESTISN